MISAWAGEQFSGSTRLTPAASSRPLSAAKTAAAKGPPLPCSTFRRDSPMTQRMRSSGSGMTISAAGHHFLEPGGQGQQDAAAGIIFGFHWISL